MNNKLILGMDIGEHTLTVTGCRENQTDIISDMYMLSGRNDGKEISGCILEFLEKKFDDKSADTIIYSAGNLPVHKCKSLEKVFRSAGLVREEIRFISRENSFVHFVLKQDKELHQHTVLAFEHTGKELWGYRLYYPHKKINNERKAEGQLIGAFCKEGEDVTFGKAMDQKFAEIAKQILSKEVVSAVYLTGQGFEGDWLFKSLKILCNGRRAFFDQNLFAIGCCHYGMNTARNLETQCVIHTPDTVFYECGVVDSSRKDAFARITGAGQPWYETKGTMDVIMERGGRMDIVFSHRDTQEKQVESVDLSQLSDRPRKTGRLEITVEFTGSNTGVILVRDKGFGQFVPSTYQVFLKEFKLL